MCLLAQKFSLGLPSRGDVVVTAMTAKPESSVTQTSIQPGDFVTLTEEATETPVIQKLDTASSTATCYGVATIGIVDFTVPVVTRGHVIVNQTDFDALKEKALVQCPAMPVAQLTAINHQGQEVEAYEVKL